MSTPPGQEQLNWWLERGGVPVTIPNAGGGGGQLCTGIGLVTSISALNTNATTPAQFALHDGRDATGPLIAAIGAGAAQPFTLGAGDGGIYFGSGLYLQAISGAMTVVVTYVPLTLPLK